MGRLARWSCTSELTVVQCACIVLIMTDLFILAVNEFASTITICDQTARKNMCHFTERRAERNRHEKSTYIFLIHTLWDTLKQMNKIKHVLKTANVQSKTKIFLCSPMNRVYVLQRCSADVFQSGEDHWFSVCSTYKLFLYFISILNKWFCLHEDR